MSNPSTASIQTIQKAYLAYYGRPADHAGLNYWASVLDGNGGNLSALIQQFGNSEESRSLYSSASVAERVEKVYQQLFNRPADAGGKAWYVAEIEAGRMSLASAALNIMNGASGDDLPLIERKVVAAQRFTDSLRDKQMSHAYGEQDILPAREYLSQVSAGMSDAALQAHLDGTLKGVMNASWASYSVASNSGLGPLSRADAMTLNGSQLLFGDSGRINTDYHTKADVFIAGIDIQTLQPGLQVRLGNTGNAESIEGLSSGHDGGTLAWGRLDTTYGSSNNKVSYVWKLDAQLQPQAAIHLGGSGGNAPEIEKVLALSDGRYLVIGSQNTVAVDGTDAFAVVLNSDFSVYAQKRFDGPAARSNESFEHALELSDGTLLVLGGKGELFHFDKSLNVLAERDVDSAWYSSEGLHALGNDLTLVSMYGRHYVVDKALSIKSYFTLSGIDRLESVAPGQFVAYDSNGEFFRLQLDASNPAHPVLTGSDYRLLAARDGYGVWVDEYVGSGDGVLAVDNNNLFSFSLGQTPSPNLAADYRLSDAATQIGWSYTVYENNALTRSGWEAGDLQIVTVGVLPGHAVETGLLELGSLTAI